MIVLSFIFGACRMCFCMWLMHTILLKWNGGRNSLKCVLVLILCMSSTGFKYLASHIAIFCNINFYEFLIKYLIKGNIIREEAHIYNFRRNGYSFFFLLCWPGIEPVAPTVKAWSLNYWTTREAPKRWLFLGEMKGYSSNHVQQSWGYDFKECFFCGMNFINAVGMKNTAFYLCTVHYENWGPRSPSRCLLKIINIFQNSIKFIGWQNTKSCIL